MVKRTFFYCTKCHNMFEAIHDSGINPVCCGIDMENLQAGTTDASQEKHVPFLTRDGKNLTVQIGSDIHPMIDTHYIQWIVVAQGDRTQRIDLHPEMEPIANFTLESDSEPVTVYEYCNLHGLWLAEA